MIIKEKDNIEISIGEYWACVPGYEVAIGNEALQKYKRYEKDVAFVKNDRIKMYMLIKMIKGISIEEAINMVLDKVHLYDKDYRKLIM